LIVCVFDLNIKLGYEVSKKGEGEGNEEGGEVPCEKRPKKELVKGKVRDYYNKTHT